MILTVGQWQLLVDRETTAAYSEQEAAEHCQCGFCRNFYSAIDGVYPKLRPFLAQFGVNIEAPDELIPYTPTAYQACYSVAGMILREGSADYSLDGLSIRMITPEDVDVNTGITDPYFFISVGLIELPWILDEPVEAVSSPAKAFSLAERILGGVTKDKSSDRSYS